VGVDVATFKRQLATSNNESALEWSVIRKHLSKVWSSASIPERHLVSGEG